MRFIHYSRSPHVAVSECDQFLRMTDHGAKPEGLWFCAGEGSDGWKAFVDRRIGENHPSFSTAQLAHQTQITFLETARCLQVRSADEIDALTREFGKLSEETIRRTQNIFRLPPAIDWPRIAEHFDAVIIAPFCKERADHEATKWYKCWDVASGCVWNARAVTLTPLTY